jgi:hypothetical protein
MTKQPKNKGRYHPTGLFGCWGSLIIGIGLPWLMFKGGLPQGRGGGSDVANGFLFLLMPIVPIIGAIVGVTIGASFGFILHLINKRRS